MTLRAADGKDWTWIVQCPAPPLCGFVERYFGFREVGHPHVRRHELPIDRAVMIIDFAEPYRLFSPEKPRDDIVHRLGFIGGLDDRFTISETPSCAVGIEITFTPRGARRCFGLPMSELARRTVCLEDVFGMSGRELSGRLAATPSWRDRFALLDRFLMRRLANTDTWSPLVDAAYQRLRDTHGQTTIAALTDDLGCTRKTLTHHFKDTFGLPPKTIARVLRFNRALHLLKTSTIDQQAVIASACGYFDQAHFINEFRQMAGITPASFVDRWLAEGSIAANDEDSLPGLVG